ncbi:MAG: branched-chain amino acid ABC transporter permease, partial [Spirochaetaceae bacterium]
DSFAIDFFDRERFNTVIGVVFVVVLLFSPDGLVGIGQRVRRLLDTIRDKETGAA